MISRDSLALAPRIAVALVALAGTATAQDEADETKKPPNKITTQVIYDDWDNNLRAGDSGEALTIKTVVEGKKKRFLVDGDQFDFKVAVAPSRRNSA